MLKKCTSNKSLEPRERLGMTVGFFLSLIKIYYDASDAPAKVSSIHLSVIDGRVTVGWSLSSSAHIEQHVLYILDMEPVYNRSNT